MSTTAPLLWAVLAVLALGGCGTERARRWYDGSCATAQDCGENGKCLQSLCARSCKTSDECGDGVCLKGHCAPPDYACAQGFCDDGNSCTDDTCDPATATCSYAYHQRACNDQDPCTLGDECVQTTGGQTACSGAAACDDGDPATTDTCAADGSCSYD